MPLEDIGYLGFWAIFEDHTLIAEHVEMAGGPGDANSIQMHLFFAWMAWIARGVGESIAEIARLADTDVVAALENAHELVDELAVGAVGRTLADSIEFEDLADLAFWALTWVEATLDDDELRTYLGLEGQLAFNESELERAIQIVDLLGNEA